MLQPAKHTQVQLDLTQLTDAIDREVAPVRGVCRCFFELAGVTGKEPSEYFFAIKQRIACDMAESIDQIGAQAHTVGNLILPLKAADDHPGELISDRHRYPRPFESD